MTGPISNIQPVNLGPTGQRGRPRNLLRTPRKTTNAAYRHRKNCSICKGGDAYRIEEMMLEWHYTVAHVVKAFTDGNGVCKYEPRSIYRHVAAVGLQTQFAKQVEHHLGVYIAKGLEAVDSVEPKVVYQQGLKALELMAEILGLLDRKTSISNNNTNVVLSDEERKQRVGILLSRFGVVVQDKKEVAIAGNGEQN